MDFVRGSLLKKLMKVAIDARALRIFRSFGNYANQVIPLLVSRYSEIDWYLLGEEEDKKLYEQKLVGLEYHFVNLSDNWFGRNVKTLFEKIPQVIKDQLFYAPAINKQKFDILWHPDNKAFWLYFGQQITTVHDIMPLLFADIFHSKAQYRFSYLANIYAVKYKAQKIVAISKSTKNDLVRLLGVKVEKVDVVYQSYNQKAQVIEDKEALYLVKRNLGLPDQFILYTGGLNPHKNVGVLVSAMARIYQEKPGFKAIKLVMISDLKTSLGINEVTIINEQIEREKISEEVLMIDFDTIRDEIFKVYNLATVFAFPSLYEGFGMPPLEAMACGVPVICSNAASLPEVVGDAGLLFDPKDVDSLVKAILRVLGDLNLQKELKNKSLAQAQKFSWDKCAKETIKQLKYGQPF